MAKEEKAKPGQQTALSAATPEKGLMAPGRALPVGLEDVNIKSLKLPQMVLMQGESPAVSKGAASPGMILNNITEEVLAKQKAGVIFIPSFYFMRRVKWIPMDAGGGIDCRSRDGIVGDTYGECGSCKFATDWTKGADGKGNIPPSCSLYHCFMGHIEGMPIPIILDMGKSKEKVAQKLLSVLMFGGTTTPWEKKYEISSIEDASKRTGKKFWNYDFKVCPEKTSEIDKEFSKSLYDMYKSKARNLAMDLQHEDFDREAGGKDGAKRDDIS